MNQQTVPKTNLVDMAVDFLAAGKLRDNNNPWLLFARGCEDPERARDAIDNAARDVRIFYKGTVDISDEQARDVIAYQIVTRALRPS